MLILGDSGIGKSTLVERLVTAAGLEGAASTRFSATSSNGTSPTPLWEDWFAGCWIGRGSPVRLEWGRGTGRTGPRAQGDGFTGLPQVPETQGETARIRLAEAIHQPDGSLRVSIRSSSWWTTCTWQMT